MKQHNNKTMTGVSRQANKQYSVSKIINRLREIKDICRENNWHASASYTSMAADSLFHMQAMGDKAQRPDFIVNLVDVHYSCYPDSDEDEECD